MVLRLILHIWSGCGGLLNGVAVADVKRCRRGYAPYRALSRRTCLNAKPYWFQPCYRVHWALHMMKCLPVPACGLLYVVQTAFGRVVKCGRVKCA